MNTPTKEEVEKKHKRASREDTVFYVWLNWRQSTGKPAYDLHDGKRVPCSRTDVGSAS